MCGIAGWITVKRGVESERVLRRMTDSIAHRGLDDEGFFIESFHGDEYEVALGHRRLSIIDLGGGHQPMLDQKTGNIIVFNGEIYNFKQLRTELIEFGSEFQSNSDTEVILHAYRHWGHQCVERFRGMFGFALWDKHKKELFIARDHFGKKPLFLTEQQGTLIFASEIKAILQYPRVSAQVNMNGLWDYFAYRYVPAPATLFQGIRKLLPGNYVVWKDGNLTEKQYYYPPDKFIAKNNVASSLDPVAEFSRILDEAVELRMISDVPFGAFLSGGIDSSAIVALMS